MTTKIHFSKDGREIGRDQLEKINVTLQLDAALFKTQRKFLTELICSASDLEILEDEEIELLQGLESLCDSIADQAHDIYGMDTLYVDEDGEEL